MLFPLITSHSQHTADYFDPVNEPEPSAETGLGTHFNTTFDPALKKDAPTLHVQFATAATGEAASEKLASTSSSMTTKELQQAAVEGDPNGLTNGLVPPNGKTEKAPALEA
jgi:hypothetical protein